MATAGTHQRLLFLRQNQTATKMLCHVTRPDSVVMEVEVDAKGNGEDCLNKVGGKTTCSVVGSESRRLVVTTLTVVRKCSSGAIRAKLATVSFCFIFSMLATSYRCVQSCRVTSQFSVLSEKRQRQHVCFRLARYTNEETARSVHSFHYLYIYFRT